MNAAKASDFNHEYGLKVVPTMMVFKDGKPVSIEPKLHFETPDAAYKWLSEHI